MNIYALYMLFHSLSQHKTTGALIINLHGIVYIMFHPTSSSVVAVLLLLQTNHIIHDVTIVMIITICSDGHSWILYITNLVAVMYPNKAEQPAAEESVHIVQYQVVGWLLRALKMHIMEDMYRVVASQ